MFHRTNAIKVRCVPCGDSCTEQRWKKYADIGNIIQRALGGDTSVYRVGGQNADISDMPDNLQDALNQQISAASLFDALTDDAKRHFGDPEGLLRALSNPAEKDNFVRLGLAEFPAEPETVKVEVVNPPVSVTPKVESAT